MTEALITSGILSCIVVIALCGTHALNGIARQMSLAIAPLVGVGYCSMLFFASTTQEDSAVHGHAIAFIPSLALTLIITAVVAVMIGLISFRMRGVGALIPTIISSIIVLFILGETHFNNKGHIRLTKLKLGDVDFHHLSMGGHTFSASTSFLILSVFFALFTMIYTANILRSPLARSMRVVAANESDAKANAISPLSSTLSAYATSGLAAAIAGSLLAYCQHSASLTAVNVWDCAFGIGLSAAIVLIYYASGRRFIISLFLGIAAMFAVVLYEYATDYPVNVIHFRNIFEHIEDRHFAVVPIVASVLTIAVVHFQARKKKIS